MSLSKVPTLLFLILIAVAVGSSQEEKLRVNKDGQLEITPQMEEKIKRQYERLKHPSFIKLEIVPESNCPDEDSKKVSDCYKAHDKITMKVLMTNTSSESITIQISKSYFPYSVQLFRDGQLVSYRKDIAEAVGKPSVSISLYSADLKPNKPEMVDMFSLDRWYGLLEPGHYLLDIKTHFAPDGDWSDTASITFEVEPK